MNLNEAANHLVKFGSILGMVLGLLSVFFWAYMVIIGWGLPFFAVNVYEVFMVIVSLIALILSYIVLTRFSLQIEADPTRSAFYLIGTGIVIAIGAWGIAGLLIIIGAVFILIDETS